MKSKRELRFFRDAEVRLAGEEQKPVITGYAAVFNSPTQIGSSFSEVIRPGAFDRALKEKQDVRALVNHNPSLIIGRTKSGTLTLTVDQKGLRYDIDPPNTTVANDLIESLKRGDIDASSFGFRAVGQKWTETTKDGKTQYLRELTDLDLEDVSPVTYPAYAKSTAGVRSLFPDGVPAEIRAISEDDCECDCPECTDDDCENCSDKECADMNCPCQQRTAAAEAEKRDKGFKAVMELKLRIAEKQ